MQVLYNYIKNMPFIVSYLLNMQKYGKKIILGEL